MQDKALFQEIRQILKKSRGEPSKFMELIECISSMDKEGEPASYPRIVRRMWPQEWEGIENKVEFEQIKWDLLCKRRREINRRVFSSPMCFKFFIELSPDKKFKILTDPEEIHRKRQKELEWDFAREKSKSNKEKILAEIIELKGKLYDLGIKEAREITETPRGKEPDLLESENTGAGVRKERKRWLVPTLAVALVILAVSITLTYIFSLQSPAKLTQVQTPTLALPDKPSVAVLPFLNMSGDSKQEYLADGITENIISALSQVPNLFVIARNSTFTYKGKAVKVQQVAEDLGVRYVLEGSVQKSGGTLRISTQLIDAMTGHHVWSERYDREMKEIFALQDDITMKVINALQVKLTEGDRARPLAKGTENLEAYLKLLQALEFTARGTGTKEGNAQSQRLLEEVMVLDPKLPQVYEYLAATHFDDVLLGWSKSPEESIKLAFELTKKAIALDESRDHPYSVLGGLYVITRQYDKAVAECEKAVALAPNSAVAHHWLGAVLMIAGKYEEAIRHSEQALRLDPFARANSYQVLGAEYFHAGRYEEAIIALKKSLHLSPDSLALHIALTSAYSWAGRHEEARAQTAEVLRIDPNFSVEERGKLFPDKNRAAVERILEGLRKAGLK